MASEVKGMEIIRIRKIICRLGRNSLQVLGANK